MADQNTETTEENVDAEATEESDESADSSSSTTDYEALFKAEKERADALQTKLAGKKFKERESKREEDTESEEDDGKPLSRKEFEAVLDRDRQERQKEMSEATAMKIALDNTSSESEAKAALLYWKNRVIPTGDLEEDMLFAIAGMNRSRIKGQQSEVKRAQNSKKTASSDGSSAHADAPLPGEPKLSSQDAFALKSAGFAWDGSRRVYKKPLGKDAKKHLYYDPKSKKRWAAA